MFFWFTLFIVSVSNTSIFSAICGKTQFSFTFPIRNKYPPLATISWFIKTLRWQGFLIFCIQIDEGGKLGRTKFFWNALPTTNALTLVLTGLEAPSMVKSSNLIVQLQIVWGQNYLSNSGLPLKFWFYAAKDANYKPCKMLHSIIGNTLHEFWTSNKPEFSDMNILCGYHI